jgi:hypothetical protein
VEKELDFEERKKWQRRWLADQQIDKVTEAVGSVEFLSGGFGFIDELHLFAVLAKIGSRDTGEKAVICYLLDWFHDSYLHPAYHHFTSALTTFSSDSDALLPISILRCALFRAMRCAVEQGPNSFQFSSDEPNARQKFQSHSLRVCAFTLEFRGKKMLSHPVA